MNDDEVREKVYEFRLILNQFWVDGFISSRLASEIMDLLPPRLKEL